MVDALQMAHDAIKRIVAIQKDLVAKAGKAKRTFEAPQPPAELVAEVEGALATAVSDAMRTPGKLEAYARLKQVKRAYLDSLPEDDTDKRAAVSKILDGLREKLLRHEVMEKERRWDGRKFDEIRDVTAEVGVLPRTHGSAVFTRRSAST